jgi:tryptophan 2,3-dioxygenase
MWGEEKGRETILPPKNKLVQDLEQNEENRYPDPDSNKKKINSTKEPNKAHKNTLKEEILQVINENFMEMLLDMVNQNIQEALKKFQDNKNKEYEKTQKQINEIIEALNKHQTETETIINREVNKIRPKINNIKEEETHYIENLMKKNNIKQNGRTFQQNRTNRRQNQNLKMKWQLKEKLKNY